MSRILVCSLLLGFVLGCGAPAPEKEEPVMPTGLENGSFNANLNGFNIHYEVHGQGPVVMTVPNSWGLSTEGLRALYRPLEENVTMVYFDPRGMGESEAIVEDSDMGMAAVRADFNALRQHLGLDQVNVIGWSNGSGNLIFLAAEYPETLSSAIFVHGLAYFDQKDMEDWAARMPELMQLYMAFQQEMADESLTDDERTARLKTMWLTELFPYSCADREAGITMLPEIFAGAQFSWPHANYANTEAAMFDGRDKLSMIAARSLVIAGAHDSFPPEKSQAIHDGLADSQFIVFENSGHFSQVEEPDAFKTAIFEFLGVE